MRHHLTSKARGPVRALLIASALAGAVLSAAAPARAFDGGCCCDDGRYDSVGFGAAGTGGGFGIGGLGGVGAGLGGLGAGLGGGYGTLGYGTPGYGTPGYGTPGYGTPGYGAPGYGAPGYGAPGYGAPAYGASGYGDDDGYGGVRRAPLRRSY